MISMVQLKQEFVESFPAQTVIVNFDLKFFIVFKNVNVLKF